MLAKYFGLFEDKLSHSGAITIRWQTDEEPSDEDVKEKSDSNVKQNPWCFRRRLLVTQR